MASERAQSSDMMVAEDLCCPGHALAQRVDPSCSGARLSSCCDVTWPHPHTLCCCRSCKGLAGLIADLHGWVLHARDLEGPVLPPLLGVLPDAGAADDPPTEHAQEPAPVRTTLQSVSRALVLLQALTSHACLALLTQV